MTERTPTPREPIDLTPLVFVVGVVGLILFIDDKQSGQSLADALRCRIGGETFCGAAR